MTRPSSGQMRLDAAEYARDAKRENAMCPYGLCTNPPRERYHGYCSEEHWWKDTEGDE